MGCEWVEVETATTRGRTAQAQRLRSRLERVGEKGVFAVGPIYLEWEIFLLLRASAEKLGRVSLEA